MVKTAGNIKYIIKIKELIIMKKKLTVLLLVLIICCTICGCSWKRNDTVKKVATNNSVESTEYENSYNDESSIRVYITKTGKRYHRKFCSHAPNIYLELSIEKAIKKGYTACYYCCY